MKVAVIGGGIIGLGIGWQLQRRGVEATVFERETAGAAASYVGAGMLAPYAEVGFEEIDLMKLGEESLRLYPQLLDELSQDTERVPELDNCGTMLVGIDRDDTEYLRRLYEFRHELDLRVVMLTGSKAREKESLLSPRVVSAVWLPDDAQVDNRMLVQSLKRAFLSLGGNLNEQTPVKRVDLKHEKVRGIYTPEDYLEFDTVVIAAGCWSAGIDGIPAGLRPPVRPVKGQILTVKREQEYDLSCMIRSPRVYLVPKQDGTIRIGATSEEKGFDTETTAGGMKELLEEGWEIAPFIYDLPLQEMIAGLRPASRDHAPIIGKTAVDGLFYATGHYRHGILLTPVTVYSIVDEIMGRPVSEKIQKFNIDRFKKQEI